MAARSVLATSETFKILLRPSVFYSKAMLAKERT